MSGRQEHARAEFERLAAPLATEADKDRANDPALASDGDGSRETDWAPDYERVRETLDLHESFDPAIAWDECWYWTCNFSTKEASEWIAAGWRWPQAAENAKHHIGSPSRAAAVLSSRNILIEHVEYWSVYAVGFSFPWQEDVWKTSGAAAFEAFARWWDEVENEAATRLSTANGRA